MRAGRLVIACAAGLGLLTGPGSAALAGFLENGHRPGAHRTPGFLTPPPPGTPVRIRPPGEVRQTDTPPAARHDWFWQTHSTAIDAAGAGRWAAALASVEARRARGEALVSTAMLRAIRTEWGRPVHVAARARNLSEALLLAVIAVESDGHAGALSAKGAEGLMQLMPPTAARFGVGDALDPAANIAGGAAYLDWLLAEFRGDILLALAAYNAGEGAVHRHGGVPPYAETRAYVVRVMDAVAAAGSLCLRPPAGPRRSCQWKPGA